MDCNNYYKYFLIGILMNIAGKFSLPWCKIPLDIKNYENDYKNKVNIFYEKGNKEALEIFIKKLEKENNIENLVHLDWDNNLGLTNITIIGGGLDLGTTYGNYAYTFHNFSPESEFGKVLFKVAEEYVNLLIE
jgi:hypothetical protein